MNGELLKLIDTIERSRDIPRDEVVAAIESAIASACRKNLRLKKEVSVNINPETGQLTILVGDEPLDISTTELGRIAAQSAKQVMIQRIKEAESGVVFSQLSEKLKQIITVSMIRMEGRTLVFSVGKAEGHLPEYEQIPGERFFPGDTFKVLVLEVRKTGTRVRIIGSRTHPDFLVRLIENEVPELQDGTVEIKAIAREPGKRSKIAVASSNPQCDPVGACLGTRGMRIRNVVRELKDEKIDVVEWRPEKDRFIVNALKPAQVKRLLMNKHLNRCVAIVPPDDLSAAIGRNGQNVRLASRLVECELDVMTEEEYEKGTRQVKEIMQELGYGDEAITALIDHGYHSPRMLAKSKVEDLHILLRIGEEEISKIREKASEKMKAEEGQPDEAV